MPPCCIAWLVMPSDMLSLRMNSCTSAVVQKVAATRTTMSSAMDTIAASTAMENIVPMP